MTRRHGWIVALIAVALAPLAFAADWSHWRGPTENGVSPEKDLPAKWGNVLWTAPYGCRSTPVVMNGRVYFINYAAEQMNGRDVTETIQERVMCLDANTGKPV